MKQLPETFRKNGYDYELVKRNSMAAIFAQKSEGAVIAYEVVKVLKFQERICFGKVLEPSEGYPSTEKWGSDAFTVHNIEKAEVYFNEFSKPKND